ncbi:universal stress protein Slr1101-like [Babylonia areolata]|uniref:universal stress protein Slr1101-like n=1 Tax=Babylonia areolata TaxID=304850 RepID=UPI003FD4F2E7
MSTVIICVDNSEHSRYALQFYLQNIHTEGKFVKVVHVPENWKNIGVMEGPFPATQHRLQAESDANAKSIKEFSEQTLASHHVNGQYEQLDGKEPWEVICQKANAEHASLIVIGTRGLSKLKRTLMGSCSLSVVHHAHCPVLVCRHKDHE